MGQLIKKTVWLFVTLLSVASAMAQTVDFKVDGPRVVAVGEVFRVEFSLNEKPSDFTPPSFGNIDVLAGPTESQRKSVQIVQGKMTSTASYSFTYALQCNSEGVFTITPATAKVDGKSYKTQSFKIEAVSEGSQPSQSPQSEQGAQPKSTIAPDDMLVRVEVDKTSVYKGQPVRVTFKLYTRLPMSAIESAKYPAFNGFWTQELSIDGYQWQRESYKDKVYDSRVIREYLIFPQQSGVLTIEQFDLGVVAQIVLPQQRRQSVFDDMFGGPEIRDVKKVLTAPPTRITVKELPAGAPESFSGAVGEFEMTATPPSNEIPANSAANYTVRISGSGNLPLIQAPMLSLPSSFEQYNTKTTDNLNNRTSGITGYRQFEYPIIARGEGEFNIPPVEFTYFSPRQMSYVTLTSKELNLTVLPDGTAASDTSRGMVSGISKEDIKFLGQDIRFIKIGSAHLSRKGNIFTASGIYFFIMLLLFAMFVFTLIWLRKRLKEMRNSALIRGKRANKMALQRFRAAERYMTAEDQRGFYEEMLKALWGYMSDNLNIPVSNLTKENVREELQKRNITGEQVESYIQIISDCEYAQYSPAASGKMQDTYARGVESVSRFESIINR